MSLSIFFCKRPNSICLLTGTKTIRGAERERDRLFSLSGDGPKTEQEEEEEGGQRHIGGRDSGVTELTESPPPNPARCGWLALVMMNGDAAQHQVPAVKALRRTRQREEVSLSAGLLGQPGLC